MGYRSDVRIITSKKGYDFLKKEVNKFHKKLNNKNLCSMLEDTDIFYENKQNVYIGWNDVKWYSTFDEIIAVEDALEKLRENDYTFSFARLGESYDDYEEYYHDSEKEVKKAYYPFYNRCFEDEIIIKEMKKDNEALEL